MYSCKKTNNTKIFIYIYIKKHVIQTLWRYKISHFAKLLVTSHTRDTEVRPTEGGAGSGGCRQRIMLEDNCRVQGADERSGACTTGALPWLSPAPLPHPQPKIPAAESHRGNNPLRSHYSRANTLLVLFHLCGPWVRRCTASPPAH